MNSFTLGTSGGVRGCGAGFGSLGACVSEESVLFGGSSVVVEELPFPDSSRGFVSTGAEFSSFGGLSVGFFPGSSGIFSFSAVVENVKTGSSSSLVVLPF